MMTIKKAAEQPAWRAGLSDSLSDLRISVCLCWGTNPHRHCPHTWQTLKHQHPASAPSQSVSEVLFRNVLQTATHPLWVKLQYF